MKILTDAETAVLTLLAEKPLHGYAIELLIEERGMREWTEIGFSSIYYVLKKLEGDGLIAGEPEAQVLPGRRGSGRKVYGLTAEGRAALQVAALAALSQPHRGKAPLLLGLANLPGLAPDAVRAALIGYAANLNTQVARLQASRDQQRPLPPPVEAMFDYSISMIQAEIAWIERFLDQFTAS